MLQWNKAHSSGFTAQSFDWVSSICRSNLPNWNKENKKWLTGKMNGQIFSITIEWPIPLYRISTCRRKLIIVLITGAPVSRDQQVCQWLESMMQSASICTQNLNLLIRLGLRNLFGLRSRWICLSGRLAQSHGKSSERMASTNEVTKTNCSSGTYQKRLSTW